MRRVLICCQVFENEINDLFSKTGISYPIVCISSEYHNDPKKLRVKLQEEIDNQHNADEILLGYGCCGNAVIGLRATTADLIIPEVEDCIAILLSKPEQKHQRQKGVYYLSKGWIDSPKDLLAEYRYTLNKYGPKKTKYIYDLMFKGYCYLMFIDSGLPERQRCMATCQEIASLLGFEVLEHRGDTWLLEKMIKCEWDENFRRINKGNEVIDKNI